mmetsp:Transcript_100682/g.260016  ORF Transcript_100682/g.260016 Transcript_100682/m.260016 type:complete len:765 (+) Transcript_100682:909-3203(+)
MLAGSSLLGLHAALHTRAPAPEAELLDAVAELPLRLLHGVWHVVGGHVLEIGGQQVLDRLAVQQALAELRVERAAQHKHATLLDVLVDVLQKKHRVRHLLEDVRLGSNHEAVALELVLVDGRGVGELVPLHAGGESLGIHAEVLDVEVPVLGQLALLDLDPAQLAAAEELRRELEGLRIHVCAVQREAVVGHLGELHAHAARAAAQVEDLALHLVLAPLAHRLGQRHGEVVRQDVAISKVEAQEVAQLPVCLVGHDLVRRRRAPAAHEAEARVLVKMAAEGVTTVPRRASRSCGDEGAAVDLGVQAVHGRRGEVLVEGMRLEAREEVHRGQGVLPHVADNVTEAARRVHEQVHWARACPTLQVQVPRRGSPGLAVLGGLQVHGDEVPEAVVLGLGRKTDVLAGLLLQVVAVGRRLVVVDLHGPVPGHRHLLRQAPQVPLLVVGLPEHRHGHTRALHPLPALLIPVFLLLVSARPVEVEVLPVGHQESAGLEGLDVHLLRLSEFVVPAVEGGAVPLPSDARRSALHRQQVVTKHLGRIRVRLRREAPQVAARPHGRGLDVLLGRLAHDDAARLQVDALVLDAHEDDPPEGVLRDGQLQRLLRDHLVHHLPHLAAVVEHPLEEALGLLRVLLRVCSGWPSVVIDVQIVPHHLIDAHRRLHLQLRVQAGLHVLAQHELVHEERRGVAHVEDGRVAERLVGNVERLRARVALVEALEDRERLVEVVADLLALHLGAAVQELDGPRAPQALHLLEADVELLEARRGSRP